jgi:E-phenylitaconyl-CoA hydratase
MAITSAVQDRIATIRMDRPEKPNALDPAHLIELRAHLSRASADTAVGVIVVTGAGAKSFCVGADLTAPGDAEAGVAEAFGLGLEASGSRGLYVRLLDLSDLHLRKPVIAAVKGSGVPNLLRAIPRAFAMRMPLTGERIAASRALEIGLVSDVWPAQAFTNVVRSLATRVAANGHLAIQMVKMLAQQSAAMPRAQVNPDDGACVGPFCETLKIELREDALSPRSALPNMRDDRELCHDCRRATSRGTLPVAVAKSRRRRKSMSLI